MHTYTRTYVFLTHTTKTHTTLNESYHIYECAVAECYRAQQQRHTYHVAQCYGADYRSLLSATGPITDPHSTATKNVVCITKLLVCVLENVVCVFGMCLWYVSLFLGAMGVGTLQINRATSQIWVLQCMSHIWISHGTYMNESWLIYEWVMAHIRMSNTSRICCVLSCSEHELCAMCRASFMREPWLFCTSAMTYSYMCDNSFMHVPSSTSWRYVLCPIHTCAMIFHKCAMTHSYICHDAVSTSCILSGLILRMIRRCTIVWKSLTSARYTYTYVNMYTYTCICVFICIYVCIYIDAVRSSERALRRQNIHICIQICIHIHIYVCLYLCMCVYI